MANILQQLAARGSGGPNRAPLRPLYTGELTYPGVDGERLPILALPKYPRSKRGPKLEITPNLAEHYVRAARSGNTQIACCALSGITQAVFQKYRKLALADPEEGESDYESQRREYLYAFIRAVEIAEALAEYEMLQVIAEAATSGQKTVKKGKRKITYPKGGVQIEEYEEEVIAPPDHKAAMWILERTRPDKYALKKEATRVEVTGEGGGPVEVEHSVTGILDAIHRGIGRIAERQQAALPMDAEQQAAIDAEFAEPDEDEE